MDCRFCKGDLSQALDLGELYPSAFLKQDESPGDKVKLSLAECNQCGLIQLEDEVDLDSLYRQYWYRSGLNSSMRDALEDIVKSIESIIELEDGDTVVDIGCNDGTLLNLYSQNVFKIGIDPALNLSSANNCNVFINDYFPTTEWKYGTAKVITAIAMFYDLPDINKFMKGITDILDEDGIFVIQLTDLYSMFKNSDFTNICHEHIEYYSFKVIKNIMETSGLEVFNVSYNKVNGGSIRVYSRHFGRYEHTAEIYEAIREEQEYIIKTGGMEGFKKRIDNILSTIKDWLVEQAELETTVAVLGASTKGNTLLQLLGKTTWYIDHAAEVNEEKFGLYTVGSNIKIISQDESLAMKPDYYLVLPFHFREFFIRKFNDYLLNGGILVFPLPYPEKVYYSEGNYTLVTERLT